MRVFVFGLGYSALATVGCIQYRLETITGTSRNPDRLRTPASPEIEVIAFDGRNPGPDVAARLSGITHILHSIAPDDAGDPVLAHHAADIAGAKPQSICYLSTVGVYGDHDGAWVNEESPCRPVSARSIRRLDAEAAWRDFCARHGIALSILRLAGIYGPGRGPFEKLRSGTSRRIIKPGQVFNRIHVDDIAQVAAEALTGNAEGIFNCADDLPAPPQDVIAHAAKLLGIEPPPEVSFGEAALSPMARTFYGENKRINNSKIKRELGVTLQYPTYREGLSAILAAQQAA